MSSWPGDTLSPPAGRRPAGYRWFLLLPVLTFGFGTFVLPLWAAARTVAAGRRPAPVDSSSPGTPDAPSVRLPLTGLLGLATVLAAVTALVLVLRAAAPTDDRSDPLGLPGGLATTVSLGLLALMLRSVAPFGGDGDPTGPLGALATTVSLALLVAGVLLALRWRTELFPPVVDARIALLNASSVPAPVAQAQARRALRSQYRELARRDLLLAREIGVGRPHPARALDDGGLVDLNSASADTLVAALELTREQAEQVVALRGQRGGLASVDELVVYGDLPMSVVDRLREYAVFLAY